MKTRTLIIFWMVLVLTAVVTGSFMSILLRHEEERLNLAWQETAREQGQWLAGNVAMLVNEVEVDLSNRLLRIPPTAIQKELLDWVRKNPLVRNVFMVEAGKVVLPDVTEAWTGEEQGFLLRYDALFNGVIPWRKPEQEQSDDFSLEAPFVQWMPWFHEERLYLLGYVMRPELDLIYGVELEWMGLLSRIIPVFERDGQGRYVFMLKDGRGELIHRTGAPVSVTDREPTAILPVGDMLPHWRVEVYALSSAGTWVGGMTRIIGLIMIIVLMAAIIGCGSLLFWLARRHMLDAARKTGFVSNVSHELKTPLTTIRMYAEMLGEGRIKEEEKRQKYLAVIIEQSQRLTRLVNNVLDFSRLEQQRKKYNLETLDMVVETLMILEEQKPRLEQVDMILEVDLPGSLMVHEMDRDVLQQVLLNLIDNAIKYAAAGNDLTVTYRLPGELLVCDRGAGIPRGQRERIFQSFQRLDDSLTTRQAGCGLGLNIARQLLRDLGGDLFYESRPAGGACFVIILPGEPV